MAGNDGWETLVFDVYLGRLEHQFLKSASQILRPTRERLRSTAYADYANIIHVILTQSWLHKIPLYLSSCHDSTKPAYYHDQGES